MHNEQDFDLAKERAKHFGEWLDEAFQTMVEFSFENKFDCYTIEERNRLDRVAEVLTDFSDMWENGQIMVSSKEREVTE